MDLTLEEKIVKLKEDAAVAKKAATLFRRIVDLDEAFDSVFVCEQYRDELNRQSSLISNEIAKKELDSVALGVRLSAQREEAAKELAQAVEKVKVETDKATLIAQASSAKAHETINEASHSAARKIRDADAKVEAANIALCGVQAAVASEERKLAELKAAIAKITGA